MASRGFECTSVQDILDTAGVTKSNFYYHFKSKEDLCLFTLQVMEDRFFAKVMASTLLNKTLSPGNRLKALFNRLLSHMENNSCQQGCAFSNLASETSDFHPEFRQRLACFYQRETKAIEQCLEEGMALGEFRPDLEPAKTAALILSIINGSMLLAKAYKNTKVMQQNVDLTLELVLKV